MNHHRSSYTLLVAIIAIVAAVGMPTSLRAQTDPQYTQYFEVPSIYNPAAIGLEDLVHIRAAGRLQWIGIKNAPRDFGLSADMPVKIGSKRIGLGIVAQTDKAGLYNGISVGIQAGYKQKLFKGELTAAVQVGFANEVFKGSDVFIPDDDDYHDSADDAIPTTDLSGNALDLGAGVFYTHRWFWAGVSCSHLTSPTITFSDESKTAAGTEGESAKNYEFQLRRTLYFMGGSNIPIKNTLFEVMPSAMVKSDFTFTRVEVTARLRYKKFLTAGLAYRHDDCVSALLGAEFKGFFIGYSYDYPTTAISKASSGSHELVLGYSLRLNLDGKNKNKHKSIRIM